MIFKKDSSGNYPTTASSNITAYTDIPDFGKRLALSSTQLAVANSSEMAFFIFKGT